MSTSHEQLSDEQLMSAYVNGDSIAFETLYSRYESILLRFIRRSLGAALAAQAEEVYQEVWMRMITARESYKHPEQGGASWKTWVFTIAYNAAVDRLRAENRYSPLPVTTDEEVDPMEWIQSAAGFTYPSSEDEAYWRAAGSQLLQCVEGLPEPQRIAFLLHHEEDHSIEEMAEQLNLSFEALRSRLRYAMQKLRHCMQHYLKEMGEKA